MTTKAMEAQASLKLSELRQEIQHLKSEPDLSQRWFAFGRITGRLHELRTAGVLTPAQVSAVENECQDMLTAALRAFPLSE